jgi:hypothetical protein
MAKWYHDPVFWGNLFLISSDMTARYRYHVLEIVIVENRTFSSSNHECFSLADLANMAVKAVCLAATTQVDFRRRIFVLTSFSGRDRGYFGLLI